MCACVAFLHVLTLIRELFNIFPRNERHSWRSLPGHVFEVQRGPAEGRHDLDGDVVVGLARHRAVCGMVLLLGLILSV